MTIPQQKNQPGPVQVAGSQSATRGIVAATIGNALEWFDIAIYALLAIYIGRNFFPSHDPGVELIQAFAVFGVSYLIRPLGGLVLGSFADRHGLKKGLTVTIRLMVLGTALLAFMPSYGTIGILAPIGIVLARLIQGFSAGGEFGAATAYLIAQNGKRKGFLGSFQFASQGLGSLLAAILVAVLTTVLSDAQMTEWGWRIPFLFGLLVGPAGYLIRKEMKEVPLAEKPEAQKHSPIREVFATQKVGMLIAGGALAVSTALNFILQYMPTFAIKELGLEPGISFTSLIITGVILTFGTPVVGHLSDKFGRMAIMVPTVVVLLVAVVPLFLWVISARSFLVLALVMTILGLLKAAYFGALPSVMSDSFDARARATGLSFSYNTAVVAFGGFTPMIASYLVQQTGQAVAPGYYLAVIAVISLAALASAVKFRGIR
ncbi:MHS family proline/betaine transporter-like MFS transporter [Arthrobacter sp. SLBN-83]|uniref:MFS transporter n=1 Tax=Arthrobacter sp. SLBN-83 TaxID=2768449 RepID=UPI001154E00C|nr:MFS transporter [Arthrobacter sp. SLBN-83]TQJ59485.1 MHS family proline/betaine transporter-like MFS transporter [Arthrobacter sp. SLBN-83]